MSRVSDPFGDQLKPYPHVEREFRRKKKDKRNLVLKVHVSSLFARK